MKRILACLCAACLMLSLCACGGTVESTESAEPVRAPAPTEAPAAAPAEAPTAPAPAPETPQPPPIPETPEPEAPAEVPAKAEPEAPAAPGEVPAQSAAAPVSGPVSEPVPAPEPTQEAPAAEEPSPAQRKAIAEGFIGQNVSALYAAIGKPLFSDYAPSCLGEGGEDGNLYYDGFIVYTYRENGVEEINYVE